MNVSGIISGAVMFFGGFALIIGGIVILEVFWPMLILGIILLTIGVYMLINFRKEDEIEQLTIKDKREG